jgi:hypothetical protein
MRLVMSRSSRLRIALGVVAIGAIVVASAVIRRADAGGVRCMLNSLELQLDRKGHAEELRAKGPEGLSEALVLQDAVLRFKADLEEGVAKDSRYASEELIAEAQGACEQAKQLVDQIAGQRDAWMSRLYWYTDLDQAKAAAAESGKPILSLRMLGQLTDEFSCANSRFFRTALYANESISRRLRDHFVLHWQSVRPVPRVTIDFGDGRKLERTVTGNSAHYVLDAAGRPLDVLPGLYGPQAFESWLERCETLAADYAAASDEAQRSELLASYHVARRDAIDADLRGDLAAIGATLEVSVEASATEAAPASPEAAALAQERTESKRAVEAPIVASLPGLVAVEELSDETWQRIAALPRHQVTLDDRSVTLMRRDHPNAVDAGRRALSKAKVEDPLARMLRNFAESAALDAVKNEYQLHRKIHTWFAEGSAPGDLDALNERVYAELFLTPSSDPWLGLAPPDAYTGLIGGGLSRSATEPTQLGSAR